VAIVKPTWLRSWLSKLNWTVLTWQINVGDAIESGIDWAIDQINNTLEWASLAYNWAIAAWDRITEVWSNILTTIAKEIRPLWNTVNVWWNRLNEWWSSASQAVLGWIDLAKDYALDLFHQTTTSINNVIAWLDTFKSLILPTLPNRREVSDNIEANVKPIRDKVNEHTTWLDLMRDFFTDPQQFIFDLLIKAIERFW